MARMRKASLPYKLEEYAHLLCMHSFSRPIQLSLYASIYFTSRVPLKSGAYIVLPPDLLRSGVIDLALRRLNEREGGTGLENLPTTKITEHTESIVRLNFGNHQYAFVMECRRAARGTL